MKKIFSTLPLLLCFLVAIAFSIRNLREPDLWWQIRTGEWIINHLQIPHQDIFSYTYAGAPWINVKWGFEVLTALISRITGPAGIFLLQAFVSCLMVFFLIRVGRLVLPISPTGANQALLSNSLSLPLALLPTLVAIEYRFNGRPEMFSHLFTLIFLYFLLRNRKEPSNRIFWLIPVQIIWANIHEAFGIGIVLAAVFFTGNWLEYFLAKRKLVTSTTSWPKNISITFAALIASVIINPNGTKLLTHPLNILGQVYENKFTTELAGINSVDYWQWNVYWVIGLLGVGLLGCVIYYFGLKTKTNRFQLFTEKFGIGYLLTLVAFLYLAATAYRNIIFLVLVFFPVLTLGTNALLNWRPLMKAKTPVQKKAAPKMPVPAQPISMATTNFLLTGFCVIAFAIYIFIVSNKYYEMTNSHDRFGLEVLSTYNPAGAGDFVKAHNLKGKCFSDYLTSSYLLWKLQPGFKTFIDLRDLDVFPSSFFSKFAEAATFPDSFHELDSVHHFSYVVLYAPQFGSLHSYLFNASDFKLAFADGVAAVYVRKTSPTDTSVLIFSPLKPITSSPLLLVVSKIINPFYSPFDYAKEDNDLMAAGYAMTIGNLDEAEKFAQRSAGNNIANYKGIEMLGEVNYNRAMQSQKPEEKSRFLENAKNYYLQSINQKDDYADAYLGLGAIYFQQRDMNNALASFEKCLSVDKHNLNACLFAAGCCRHFVSMKNSESIAYAQQALSYYKRADKLNPDNPDITLNIGFLYSYLNDCPNCIKFLSKVADFPGLTAAQRKQAKECLRKCGSPLTPEGGIK